MGRASVSCEPASPCAQIITTITPYTTPPYFDSSKSHQSGMPAETLALPLDALGAEDEFLAFLE